MTDLELLDALRKIDTPTVTNVVATYPGRPLCLESYHPWNESWYTNNTLRCWYPELGPIAGYAVTCTYGLPDPTYKKLSLMDVLEAMDKLGTPSIFCFQQKFPLEIADKVGLSGGNMTSSMRACGAKETVSAMALPVAPSGWLPNTAFALRALDGPRVNARRQPGQRYPWCSSSASHWSGVSPYVSRSTRLRAEVRGQFTRTPPSSPSRQQA